MCWEDVVKAPPSEARTVIPDTGVLVGLADMLSMDLLDTYMRNTRQNAIPRIWTTTRARRKTISWRASGKLSRTWRASGKLSRVRRSLIEDFDALHALDHVGGQGHGKRDP